MEQWYFVSSMMEYKCCGTIVIELVENRVQCYGILKCLSFIYVNSHVNYNSGKKIIKLKMIILLHSNTIMKQ
jgi:hypothetical protein